MYVSPKSQATAFLNDPRTKGLFSIGWASNPTDSRGLFNRFVGSVPDWTDNDEATYQIENVYNQSGDTPDQSIDISVQAPAPEQAPSFSFSPTVTMPDVSITGPSMTQNMFRGGDNISQLITNITQNIRGGNGVAPATALPVDISLVSAAVGTSFKYAREDHRHYLDLGGGWGGAGLSNASIWLRVTRDSPAGPVYTCLLDKDVRGRSLIIRRDAIDGDVTTARGSKMWLSTVFNVHIGDTCTDGMILEYCSLTGATIQLSIGTDGKLYALVSGYSAECQYRISIIGDGKLTGSTMLVTI